MAPRFVRLFHSAVVAVLTSLVAVTASAAAPVHIVKTDLKAGIRAGLDSPLQFAVNVEALTATLTASPTSLMSGSSFTLTWSSTAATGCTGSGGGALGLLELVLLAALRVGRRVLSARGTAAFQGTA